MSALDRVRSVIAIGRRVADPADSLGRTAREELATTSSLSREGIDLALEQHLETQPSDEDLDRLVSRSRPAERCVVVLSAHVCTAALRAIAVAIASTPSVIVKPSRRDPVLAGIFARELGLAVVDAITPAPGDAVHVYGSDDAIRAIRAACPAGVVFTGHGPGMGLAIVGAGERLKDAANALARDVVPFDQAGCLSPRHALVEGDASRAETFARELARALAEAGRRVPRGRLDPTTAGELATYKETMRAIGEAYEGAHHLVAIDPSPRALVLPPAARAVHVAPASPREVDAVVGPWARFITSIGGAGELAAAARRLAPSARTAELGAMQRPPLDGPVDRRQDLA